MTLIRWNPAYRAIPSDPFQTEVDRLCHSVLAPSSGKLSRTVAPAVDIEETKESFVFRADLPGIKAEDLKLSLEAGTLTLRGERKPASPANDSNRRTERAFGAFERQFTFDTPVQSDAVSATYRDGVLEVTVPKAENAKVRDIQIQVG